MQRGSGLNRFGRGLWSRIRVGRVRFARYLTSPARSLLRLWSVRAVLLLLRISGQATLAQKARQLLDPLHERVARLSSANIDLRDRVIRVAAQNRLAANPPIRAQIADTIFAANVASSLKWHPNHIIAHDLNTVPVGTFLAREFGAKLTVDAVESLEFAERTGAYYHKHFVGTEGRFLESLIHALLKTADVVTTISPFFVEYFEARGCTNVRFLPNYRNMTGEKVSQIKRSKEKLPPVFQGNLKVAIPNAFDDPVPLMELGRAAAQLGLKLEFKQMGLPPESNIRRSLNQAFGAASPHSIEYCGVKPHSQFLEALSACHFAVSLFEPKTNNIVNAFPNRLFDCIAAGTPLFVTGMRYTGDYLIKNGFGAFATGNDAESLAGALQEFVPQVEQISSHMRARAVDYSWDAKALQVFDYINPGEKVLIVGKKRLNGHVRVGAIANAIRRIGAHCEIYGVDHEGPTLSQGVNGVPLFIKSENE